MKKKYINRVSILAPIFAAMTMFIGCTDKFEEYNVDPYGISKGTLDADFNFIGEPFKQVQLNIYTYDPAWSTQLQQNLMGDVFSGYMMPPTPFAGNVNNMTYALVDGWNGQPWTTAYNAVMGPIKSIHDLIGDDYPHFRAWSLILRVEGMHRVSDIYGPIIYTNFGKINENGSISYDSQEDAYNAFFDDLDEAINTLEPYAQDEKDGKIAVFPFAKFDLVYGGSYVKWVKFANTLRLRLALRISKVDAAKAKLEGEKSLASSFGLLSTLDDNFLVNIGTTTHPLNVMNNAWGDIRMGAPMESIMGGYNDPRLSAYFVRATDAAVSGQYKGIRQGINIDGKARYLDYSKLITFQSKIQLMTTAEAFFLKAEAALYNWANAGDEKENYEAGVKASFELAGVSGVDSYLADDTKKPMEYTDPKAVTAGENDVLEGSPYLSTITIKWDDSASDEEKLERIITQKWIAVYPDGQEAWSEVRRTGYPKLFPVVINNSGGKISTTEFIKRINFASGEYTTNPSGVNAAVGLLGGADTGGTPLWWDVD